MDTLEMNTTESEAPEEASETSGASQTAETSLLTRDEAPAPNEADERQTTKEERQDPNDLVPEKPEEYNLSFGKDVQVDKDLLTNFSSIAHEMGLQKGQAQKLANLYAEHTAQATKSAYEAQMASLAQAKNGWEKEIESRPYFQQEVADARRTLKEFGSPELNEIMDSSLLGSHPVFFDFVVNVGKALAEPEIKGRSHSGGIQEKPLMDRLWPEMK